VKKLNYKMGEENLTRINKYLSEIGYCSRREADRLINSGRIMVNGKKAEMGIKISPGDKVSVNGEVLNHPQKKKYLSGL
tara:strand:+ start:916 stop:1152 length:237 start_codon:yes stop_codon:yes gene_type:complete